MGPPTSTIHDNIVAEIYYDDKIHYHKYRSIHDYGSRERKIEDEEDDKREAIISGNNVNQTIE